MCDINVRYGKISVYIIGSDSDSAWSNAPQLSLATILLAHDPFQY